MKRALLIVDVQNDFTEGGALGVAGGDAVARGITEYLAEHAKDYALVVTSRDWHDPNSTNEGHFSVEPDYVNSWPVHCVAGTPGAAYNPLFETSSVTEELFKGQGRPDYSLFQGTTRSGETADELLKRYDISDIDVVGLATDYCVRASALDALNHHVNVRVLEWLVAGVAEESSSAALHELRGAGAEIIPRPVV